jgi:hypothetical protein
MKPHDQHHDCACDHHAADLAQEMQAGRPVHEYRERRDTGEVVLVCLSCFGLWNHRFTDQIIAMVQSGEALGTDVRGAVNFPCDHDLEKRPLVFLR